MSTATPTATGSSCIFKPVKYTKDPGTMQPVYEFPIEYTGTDIIIDADGHPVLDVLTTYLSHDGTINSIMTELVAANKGIFAKTYTAYQLLKITRHSIGKSEDNTGSTWKCIPVRVILSGGRFNVVWDLHALDVPMIDLGDIASRGQSRAASPVPSLVSSPVLGAISSASPEMVDITKDVMEGVQTVQGADMLNLRSQEHMRKERERVRIEEARLRAKIAVLRAEKVIQKYIDRYGEDDLSLSESDSDDDTDGCDYSDLS